MGAENKNRRPEGTAMKSIKTRADPSCAASLERYTEDFTCLWILGFRARAKTIDIDDASRVFRAVNESGFTWGRAGEWDVAGCWCRWRARRCRSRDCWWRHRLCSWSCHSGSRWGGRRWRDGQARIDSWYSRWDGGAGDRWCLWIQGRRSRCDGVHEAAIVAVARWVIQGIAAA